MSPGDRARVRRHSLHQCSLWRDRDRGVRVRPLLDDEQLLVVTWPDDDDMSSVLVVDAAGRLGWVALMALRGGP